MGRIRIAIAGVGNCASALVQGIGHYAVGQPTIGLAHPMIGPYALSDMEVSCAFDVDVRKVDRPLNDALAALPNNTKVFHPLPPGGGPRVLMGPVLDGVADHLSAYPDAQRFIPAGNDAVDVVAALKASGAAILLNYMPVGAQHATEHYAQACLDAGVAFVNCVPVFIVSQPAWAEKFRARGLPCVGDDIKAQLGATITHRTLIRLFERRGVRVDSTYQLNTGGNTDFLNMLSRERLSSKKVSKTEAVQSQLETPLPPERIHVGPSDYVPFLKDNKVCFLRIEGTGFGGVPMNLELRLSVEDSPNSAGIVADAVRCCQLALDAGVAGPIVPVCAWTMKRPPEQFDDAAALAAMETWIAAHAGR